MAASHAESADAFLDTLVGERQRLQNAVDHLQQSNKDLRVAIEKAGPDRDFKEAIEENIVVIAKYVARIARLDKEIGELRQGLQSLHHAQAILAGEAGGSGGGGLQQAQAQQQQTGLGSEGAAEGGSAGPQMLMRHQQQQDAEMLDTAELTPSEGDSGHQPPEQQDGMWL